ncbi:acyltransferase domain-containing protein [Glycomyces halotolerans]
MINELPPAGRVRPFPLPGADRVEELLTEWCRADRDDTEAAIAALDRLDGDALELADRMYQSIAADMGGRKWLTWPKPPEDHPLLGLFPVLAAVPLMRDHHRRLGVPEERSRPILEDVGEKLRLNRALYGRPGLDVSFWFTAHVRGSLYQLGRLQFCLEGTERSPLIGLHIRGEGGSLGPEAVRASVAEAMEFFPATFPERFGRAADLTFTCTSWLLDPQLRDWLPERSNILKFAALFDLIGPRSQPGTNGHDDVWRFVFTATPGTPVELLPTENTLQRSLIEGIKAGVDWQVPLGRLDPSRLGL